MSSSEAREAIVKSLRDAQRSLFDVCALCARENINFIGGVPADVSELALAIDPDAVVLLRDIP